MHWQTDPLPRIGFDQSHRDVLCIRMFDDIAETFLK